MSNYSALKTDINNNIYENNTQQITGTVLNTVLKDMVATLGAGYQFAGCAYLDLNPGAPDAKVFYLAGEGLYPNFDNIQVPAGKLGILKWDTRWRLETIEGLGGGGANLTGYVSLPSVSDLPEVGQPTLGYLIGENLYLYVGEGGDTADGKYQNCGSFRGPEGVSITDIEQVVESVENGGRNTIRITLSDGHSYDVYVRNGKASQGLFPDAATLNAQRPNPSVGEYAFVGSGFPADIYVCNTAGTWTDSGADYDGDNVDLTDYATKAELSQLEAEVADNTDNIEALQAEIDGINPIVIEGNVTNAPDEEDITSENDLLKFKDRTQAINGQKGYVILRKNKTFAEQVVDENTIYEIRYAFDLDNGTVVIPEGCTLKFNGGTIDNGCLVGTHTKIDADNVRIFGRNIALTRCAFIQKRNDLEDNKTILPWIDLSRKRVECKSSENRLWKIKTSGAVAFSNADGLGQFVQLSGEEYLDIETEMRLSNNPGAFKQMNTGSTINTVSFNGTESGNYLVIYNAIKEDDRTTFVVPHSDRFVFFNSNDAGDNPNDTVIAPGTTIDLTQNTVYVGYLGIAYFDLSASTWDCEARLEWFVSDYSGDYSLVSSSIEQSRQLQNALDCPMNITSGICGAVRCDYPIYAMVSKKVELGGNFDFTGMDNFRSNAKFKAGHNIKGTAICCTTDINLFYLRNKVDIQGGAFIAELAVSHTKSVIVLDGAYNASYSHIKTSILGKGYSTMCGILADYYEKDVAYNSFSEIECYIARCRYSLRSIIERTNAYINSQIVRLICNTYAEAVSIDNTFGASEFYLMLQDGAIIPKADVDNYVHFKIISERCSITAIPWDWATEKNSDATQRPYKDPIIGGTNMLLTGTSGTALNVARSQNYQHPGFAGHDPKVIYAFGQGQRFLHPYLGNSLAHFSGKSDALNSANCYLSRFKVSTPGFNVDTYNDILKGNADVTETTTTAGIFTLINLFGPTAFVSQMSLDADEFAEIVLEASSGFTFDNSKLWNEFALVFLNNPWKRAKLICWKNGTKYNKTFDLSGNLFEKNSISISAGINKICLRLYGDAENAYGVGQAISSLQVIPQIVGYSTNLNDNYWLSHYQSIRSVPTTSRPTTELFQGLMVYDRTLHKPIWYKGSGVWVDATGTSV